MIKLLCQQLFHQMVKDDFNDSIIELASNFVCMCVYLRTYVCVHVCLCVCLCTCLCVFVCSVYDAMIILDIVQKLSGMDSLKDSLIQQDVHHVSRGWVCTSYQIMVTLYRRLVSCYPLVI